MVELGLQRGYRVNFSDNDICAKAGCFPGNSLANVPITGYHEVLA